MGFAIYEDRCERGAILRALLCGTTKALVLDAPTIHGHTALKVGQPSLVASTFGWCQ